MRRKVLDEVREPAICLSGGRGPDRGQRRPPRPYRQGQGVARGPHPEGDGRSWDGPTPTPDDVDEVLDWREQQIFEISQEKISRSFVPVKNILKGTFQLIETSTSARATSPAFHRVSKIRRDDGGAPAVGPHRGGGPALYGKTSFCLNIAQHAAVQERIPVAIFSLEMSKEQLVQRMLCSVAKVDSHKLRTGYLSDSDWRS